MYSSWDQHNHLYNQTEIRCHDTQRPSAAPVQHLNDRGLLENTLALWGGKFGRTPFGQGDLVKPKGRDHFKKAFLGWLAVGGVKSVCVHGAIAEDAWDFTSYPVHVHDMQATIKHLLGVDHTRLTC